MIYERVALGQNFHIIINNDLYSHRHIIMYIVYRNACFRYIV